MVENGSLHSSDTKSNKVYKEDVLAIPYGKEDSVCRIEFCRSQNSNGSFMSEEIVFTDQKVDGKTQQKPYK